MDDSGEMRSEMVKLDGIDDALDNLWKSDQLKETAASAEAKEEEEDDEDFLDEPDVTFEQK